MKLYKGRPENTQRRLDKEIRVYDLLDSLGIEYERTDHEQADTMNRQIPWKHVMRLTQSYRLRYVRIFSCVIGKRQTSICL